MNTPGLKIVAPSTRADAYGLLKAAIRDDGPVVYADHGDYGPQPVRSGGRGGGAPGTSGGAPARQARDDSQLFLYDERVLESGPPAGAARAFPAKWSIFALLPRWTWKRWLTPHAGRELS